MNPHQTQGGSPTRPQVAAHGDLIPRFATHARRSPWPPVAGILGQAGAAVGFREHLLALAVRSGNGTTAGTVDFGGGSLGSIGANNFNYAAVATAKSYALGLFDVAAGYSMDAKNNSFLNPLRQIADGRHDPAAGGSGSIVT